MKTTDKFLIGIVVTIILIVIAAIAVTLARPEKTYLADDAPENVVHNYLLALQKKEYARAYGYLSPDLPGYPGYLEAFKKDIASYSWQFRNDQRASFTIEGVEKYSEQAIVKVLKTQFYDGDIFSSGQYISTFEMEVVLIDGQWKIEGGDDYFIWCWLSNNRCK